MRKLVIFVLLVFLSLSFAAQPEPPASVWQTTAMAIAISLALVGIFYAIGTGFSINELQFMAKEEFFQVIAVVIMVGFLFGTTGILDSISQSSDLTGNAPTIQQAAHDILDSTLTDTSTLLTTVYSYDQALSEQASQSYSCSISGIGYTVSGCGGFSMLATPISMSGSILGFAIGELSAMKRLVEISQNFAVPLLLPFGILLRTFKLTRGAGGLLIAVAISLHLLLPIGIIFNDMLAQQFLATQAKAGQAEYVPSALIAPGDLPTCNPADTGSSPGGKIFGDITTIGTSAIGDFRSKDNEDRAVLAYAALRDSIRSQLFVILIRATFASVISLLMVAAGIRAITAIAGADVDVSAISRFV